MVIGLCSVADLLVQQVRVIVVVYIDDPRGPTHSLLAELVSLRQQQVVLIELFQFCQPVLPIKELVLILHAHCRSHHLIILCEPHLLHSGVVQTVLNLRVRTCCLIAHLSLFWISLL